MRKVPGRLLSASVESQMTSAQNNSYAKVAYFGGHVIILFNYNDNC